MKIKSLHKQVISNMATLMMAENGYFFLQNGLDIFQKLVVEIKAMFDQIHIQK